MTRFAWLRAVRLSEPIPRYKRVFAEIEGRIRKTLYLRSHNHRKP